MLSLLSASLMFAQAAAPMTGDEARLTECIGTAVRDPATAIATASEWLAGTTGPDSAAPQQCLGHAYVGLLRWDAAEQAFLTARSALAQEDGEARARLAAMAGNAALAAEAPERALEDFSAAATDAGETPLAGEITADAARAFVALGRNEEAAAALAKTRRLAPQYAAGWLLSAALARRMDDLDAARGFIATAAALAPQDTDIGLEAGVIAALQGRDAEARAAWQAVRDIAPGTPAADTAMRYQQQLTQP